MDIIYSNIYVNFIIIAAAFYILFKAADLFVDAAIGISQDLHIPKFIVGVIIVGFATTAPEITVSVISAMKGQSEFALGNALGSVIVDDGVALGLAAVLAPVPIVVHRMTMFKMGSFLLASLGLSYILAANGIISRAEGAILVVMLFTYWGKIVWTEAKNCRERNKQACKVEQKTEKSSVKSHVVKFLIGLGGVIIASHFIVGAAEQIAIFFSVPKVIIGLTVIAIGTSLPEISTAIIAARKGEGEIAVGNIIGADLLNVLWIIGVSSMVRPINISHDRITVKLFKLVFENIPSVHFSFIWSSIFCFLAVLFVITRQKLVRWEGYVLLGLYVIYFYMNFSMFTG